MTTQRRRYGYFVVNFQVALDREPAEFFATTRQYYVVFDAGLTDWYMVPSTYFDTPAGGTTVAILGGFDDVPK